MMDLPARQKAISLPGDLSNTKFGFVNIQAGHKKPCEVLLIDMPFGLLFSPSLGLSLLRASLKATNVQSKILYFTFRFAERIGTALYLRLQPAMNSLVGEWVFADSLFESARLNQKQYVDEILTRRLAKYKDLLEQTEEIPDRYVEEILNIREQTSEFLDDCLNDVLAYKPLIVGFTSVFQQHVSSLALAKRIKERAPETFILFGGANCEGVMGAELLRQFGFVDTVVSGEADQIFAEIVRRVLDGKSLNGLQGLFTNAERQTPPSKLSAPMIQNMDALPLVDYDDYMSQFERSRLDQKYVPWIPVETSRGCWWGETLHCTFCGLNGMNMPYRRKSSERSLKEFEYLAEKYPGCPITIVDNILDMKYFDTLIPKLAQQNLNLHLWCSLKSNLKKDHIAKMRAAGIRTIQPGIESLSTEVLKIMRKGVTGLQNIQLLKWCKEFGIEVSWNMIWGFPYEPPEAYSRMANLVPLLTHLQPPSGASSIRIDRFSPNFDDAQQLGFCQPQPAAAYSYVYPFAAEVLNNLAYFFTAEYQQPVDVESYTAPLWKEIIGWKKHYHASDVFSVDKGSDLLIFDLRPTTSRNISILNGIQKDLFLFCDGIRTERELLAITGTATERNSLHSLLEPLMRRHLMLKEGNSYLNLCIPLGQYSPCKEVMNRVDNLLTMAGTISNNEVVLQSAKFRC